MDVMFASEPPSEMPVGGIARQESDGLNAHETLADGGGGEDEEEEEEKDEVVIASEEEEEEEEAPAEASDPVPETEAPAPEPAPAPAPRRSARRASSQGASVGAATQEAAAVLGGSQLNAAAEPIEEEPAADVDVDVEADETLENVAPPAPKARRSLNTLLDAAHETESAKDVDDEEEEKDEEKDEVVIASDEEEEDAVAAKTDFVDPGDAIETERLEAGDDDKEEAEKEEEEEEEDEEHVAVEEAAPVHDIPESEIGAAVPMSFLEGN
jgi:hypothetical protein